MGTARLTVEGLSVAGMETCIEVPSLKLALDMGRCTHHAVGLPWVLVSHGHLDHCGALPQHAARRSLLGMEEGRYVVPRALLRDVEELFNAAGRLDGNPIAHTLIPLDPGETLELGKHRFLRPFPTLHRVVSQGYLVMERRHHLKPAFAGLAGEELGRLRKLGADLSEVEEAVLLAFTGDTRVEVLEQVPALGLAETLVMEASFLDGKVSVEQARTMGHVHLDELLERQHLLPQTDVMLCHFSARYRPEDVRSILQERLPPALAGRVRALC